MRHFLWQLGWTNTLAPQISISNLVGAAMIGAAPVAYLYACNQNEISHFAWDIDEYWEACGRGEN
jgi:hypothetical protein